MGHKVGVGLGGMRTRRPCALPVSISRSENEFCSKADGLRSRWVRREAPQAMLVGQGRGGDKPHGPRPHRASRPWDGVAGCLFLCPPSPWEGSSSLYPASSHTDMASVPKGRSGPFLQSLDTLSPNRSPQASGSERMFPTPAASAPSFFSDSSLLEPHPHLLKETLWGGAFQSVFQQAPGDSGAPWFVTCCLGSCWTLAPGGSREDGVSGLI